MATDTAEVTINTTVMMMTMTSIPTMTISIAMKKPSAAGIPTSCWLGEERSAPSRIGKATCASRLAASRAEARPALPSGTGTASASPPPDCVNVVIGGHVVLSNHRTNVVVELEMW
jgi:hypothetical protein